MDYVEEFDKFKTKVLKYILYKKRTEQEIRQKFNDADEDMLEDVVNYFKEQNYINDVDYIEKAVREYKNLKNMSIKEITYKLQCKGLKRNLIESYIDENKEELLDYEVASAKNISIKKNNILSQEEFINMLKKKGYTNDTVRIIKYELKEE